MKERVFRNSNDKLVTLVAHTVRFWKITVKSNNKDGRSGSTKEVVATYFPAELEMADVVKMYPFALTIEAGDHAGEVWVWKDTVPG